MDWASVPVSMSFNGRPFDPDDFEAHLRAQFVAGVRAELGARLDGLRCEEHHAIPEVVVGDDLQNAQVRGCCATLIARAEARLRGEADVTPEALPTPGPSITAEVGEDRAETADARPAPTAATCAASGKSDPREGTPPRAFISHSSADKERFVRPLVDALHARGVETWLDEKDLVLGDNVVIGVFERGIARADVFVAVLSENSAGKPWVEAELTVAIARQISGDLKRVIPIRLDGVTPPASLSATLWADAPEPFEFETLADRIAGALHGTRPAPLAPAPAYTRIPVHGIVGLQPDDERLFVFACEQLLARASAHPIVDLLELTARALAEGMGLELVNESIAVLEQQRLFVELRHYGPTPAHAGISPFAFERYLNTYRGEAYQRERLAIIAAIVNEKLTYSRALVRHLGIHEYVVDHVLKDLERQGHVLASHHMEGIDVIPEPTLARVLRNAGGPV